MKALVVFYSRADENYFGGEYCYLSVGNTEKLAQMISQKTGADLFKVEQKIPYAKDYKTCIAQAKRDMLNNARPELVQTLDSIDQYDTIYIGYPNYWGAMPMALYTFVESFDWTGKTVCPFCTHEGSGFGLTVKELRGICKGATFNKGFSVAGSMVDGSEADVDRWLNP